MADDKAPVGDPLLARLERLTQRRGPVSTGQPLPPPSAWNGSTPASPPFRDDSPQPSAPARQPTQPQSASPARRRRNHPAKSARIGALFVSCAATGGLAYFFADANRSDGAALVQAPRTVATTTPLPTTSQGQSPAIAAPTTVPTGAQSPATSAPTSTATAGANSQSGAVQTFGGAVEQTRYGPVSVEAQISDGKLVEVNVVSYPDGDRRSAWISEQAIPELRSEVLSAQSSQVDTVSGATYTSDGYLTSLQSALDQARSAGATVIV